ncbi:MAG TPA: phosphatidylglycerol lysyltransferase domain-containing protein, partial [Ignavibacteriaceae bacterium]
FNFCRYNGDEIVYNAIPLQGKRKWICATRVPYGKTVEETFKQIFSQLPDTDLLFDGCTNENRDFLKAYGFNSITFGKEAIIDLSKNEFQKKSLKELIKRGKRHGAVVEVKYSEDNEKKLQEFFVQTSHGREPRLQNLFATAFKPYHRLFVLKKDEIWISAIMLSFKDEKFMQTELILRSSKAPVGVMEALINEILIQLKKEELEYWSLGAVPFVDYDSKFLSLSWFFNSIGRKIKFAYNYRGLFNFKNKFNPIWQPYYLCYKNKLNPIQIFQLSQKSNLNKLIIYNILTKLGFNYGK